jgi:hypothetical protein
LGELRPSRPADPNRGNSELKRFFGGTSKMRRVAALRAAAYRRRSRFADAEGDTLRLVFATSF